MRKFILGALVAVMTAAGVLANVGTAAAGTAVPAGYYLTRASVHTEYLNHYGDPLLGQVKLESWTVQIRRNSDGVVVGTQSYEKLTDIQGGVQALDLRYIDHRDGYHDQIITGQSNNIGDYSQTPGTQVSVEAYSSQSQCCYFAHTVGDPDALGWMEGTTTFAIRWADGVLGTYVEYLTPATWYRCYGFNDLHNCGSYYVQ
jgi:hypothetical protein